MSKPKDITVDRASDTFTLTWPDNHVSVYELSWLRANCPCATCREDRREAAENTDPLRLIVGPPPSTEVAGAEFVGNYAVRLEWDDGHNTGIFTFVSLRECCPCTDCNPDGPPPIFT